MTEWISQAKAAEIAGCSVKTIEAHMGELVRRDRHGGRPCLDRASVEQWGARRRAAREAAAASTPPRPPVDNGPPADGRVWLDAAAVAVMIDRRPEHVHRLARTGRIPATRLGARWWFLREHAEQYAAARAFRAARTS